MLLTYALIVTIKNVYKMAKEYININRFTEEHRDSQRKTLSPDFSDYNRLEQENCRVRDIDDSGFPAYG